MFDENPLVLGEINSLATSMGSRYEDAEPIGCRFPYRVGEKHHISALARWGSGFIAVLSTLQMLVFGDDGEIQSSSQLGQVTWKSRKGKIDLIEASQQTLTLRY